MPFPSFDSPKKPKAADTSARKPVALDAPIINPEADRILGRATLQALFVTGGLLIVAMLAGAFVSQPGTPLFKYHKPIAYLTVLPVLLAWYGLNGRLYAKRLEIGRDLVGKREFRQAAVCLQPFESFGQRFLDRTGEAHYLLAQAYAGSNQKAKAEKCKTFVLKYRPGPWAAKLGGSPAVAARAKAETTVAAGPRPRPSKSKPKRRF